MNATFSKEDLEAKNKKVGLAVLFGVICMVGMAFASVPLYDLFCRVTGFGGTTQVSETLPDQVIDRNVTVKFNTDVNRNLPWTFRSETRAVDVKIGQDALINYRAENVSGAPVAGTAIYNVTPPKVGEYFHKVQCFCFNEQILQPSQSMNMPVMFYIDPAFHEDPYMDDVSTITLSYTFFKTESAELEQALEDFYEN